MLSLHKCGMTCTLPCIYFMRYVMHHSPSWSSHKVVSCIAPSTMHISHHSLCIDFYAIHVLRKATSTLFAFIPFASKRLRSSYLHLSLHFIIICMRLASHITIFAFYHHSIVLQCIEHQLSR